MDTLYNRMVKKYFDAMLKTAEYMTVKEYGEKYGSPQGVRGKIAKGIEYIAEATDGDEKNLNPDYVFKRIVERHAVSYYLFNLIILEYIEKQDKELWEYVPHKGELPDSGEYFDYLIEKYREKIIKKIG